jgi:RNA polymerase sigma-70 factor (ECF subfamily)
MQDRRGRFEEVYDLYSGQILAFVARRTGDPDSAADVVAETFTVAWRRIDDVPDGDGARAWLYAVARRVIANHLRSERRRRALDRRLANEISNLIASATGSDGPDRAAIASAFAELSESDRELLTLAGWEVLDRDEIATVLDCSRAKVRVRLHRARRRFEDRLREHGVKRMVSTGHVSSGWTNAFADAEDP